MPDNKYICYCNKVTENDCVKAIKDNDAKTVDAVIQMTGAMQNSNCAVNNPKGVCCYPDILKIFNRYKACIVTKRMTIYEPAMCCDAGTCGASVDPELLRISAVLNALKNNGVDVARFNLTGAPMAFVNNKSINTYINEKGVEGLPAIMVDGEIIMSARYPTNAEFVSLLGVPESYLSESEKNTNSCCGCG